MEILIHSPRNYQSRYIRYTSNNNLAFRLFSELKAIIVALTVNEDHFCLFLLILYEQSLLERFYRCGLL